MRTKTLLLTAALSAAGIATSMAQAVYSVNAVGYVNTSLVAGYNLISNPLNNTAANGNQIKSLFASLPPGAQIFMFNTTTAKYDLASVDEFTGEITGPAADKVLMPGDGVFVRVSAPTTITFVGEVMQGTALSTPIPKGFSIKSSQVPQAGTATQLNFPGADGDQLFFFNEATQKYSTAAFEFGAWSAEPVIDVGEAIFVSNPVAAKNWTRSFSVNP